MKRITINKRVAFLSAAMAVVGCASVQPTSDDDVRQELRASFQERGMAKIERLDQTELQRVCSAAATTGQPLDAATRARLEKAALDTVKYPADNQYLGDWKQGERIAQTGVGLQFSDTASTVNGGNCYACHQLAKAELAYGNIGPSLYQYGKLRGTSEPILKYTWAKVWNAHGYNACSQMPRFGDAGILTQEQLRHVMALLLDPASPVNQ